MLALYLLTRFESLDSKCYISSILIGQGKATKAAFSKTRTASGPRRFGNITELVLVKELESNIRAAGGDPMKKKKASVTKKTVPKMKSRMAKAEIKACMKHFI